MASFALWAVSALSSQVGLPVAYAVLSLGVAGTAVVGCAAASSLVSALGHVTGVSEPFFLDPTQANAYRQRLTPALADVVDILNSIMNALDQHCKPPPGAGTVPNERFAEARNLFTVSEASAHGQAKVFGYEIGPTFHAQWQSFNTEVPPAHAHSAASVSSWLATTQLQQTQTHTNDVSVEEVLQQLQGPGGGWPLNRSAAMNLISAWIMAVLRRLSGATAQGMNTAEELSENSRFGLKIQLTAILNASQLLGRYLSPEECLILAKVNAVISAQLLRSRQPLELRFEQEDGLSPVKLIIRNSGKAGREMLTNLERVATVLIASIGELCQDSALSSVTQLDGAQFVFFSRNNNARHRGLIARAFHFAEVQANLDASDGLAPPFSESERALFSQELALHIDTVPLTITDTVYACIPYLTLILCTLKVLRRLVNWPTEQLPQHQDLLDHFNALAQSLARFDSGLVVLSRRILMLTSAALVQRTGTDLQRNRIMRRLRPRPAPAPRSDTSIRDFAAGYVLNSVPAMLFNNERVEVKTGDFSREVKGIGSAVFRHVFNLHHFDGTPEDAPRKRRLHSALTLPTANEPLWNAIAERCARASKLTIPADDQFVDSLSRADSNRPLSPFKYR